MPHQDNLRASYEAEVRELRILADRMRDKGVPLENIARALSGKRLAIAKRYKMATPEPQRSVIIARTIAIYGNPDGPSIDYLRMKGKSWEEIISSSFRPGCLVV